MSAAEIRHFHLFCGLGGGAKGFNQDTAHQPNVCIRRPAWHNGAALTKKVRAGIGLLKQPHDESRGLSAESAASLSVPPVLAARMGERKLRRFPQGLSGRPTHSSCRPRLVSGAVVVANHSPWRSIMALALIGAPAPVIAVVDGIPTTTSVDIARHFGKQHRNVVQAIEGLIVQLPSEALLNFQHGSYTLPETGSQQHKLYRLTRDGFTLLAMGFTGKKALAFKLAYIDAFNKMEAELQKPAHDAERVRQAFELASEVGAVAARTVFEALIQGKEASLQDRWMFCMGHPNRNGVAEPWAKPIQGDAMVVSLKDLPRRLLEPNGMLPSNKELADLAAACNQRLAQRMEYEARKAVTP